MLSQYFVTLWDASLAFSGKTLIAFLVFNIMFMLMGRFRFNLVTALFFVFYVVFFENRKLIDQYFDDTGLAAMFIAGGAVFLSLAIWSFFIETD
jgi:hypothetical protein